MFTSDPPLAYMAVSYLLAFVISYFMYTHLKREKERAAAGDHRVETSRDVAVPDHCVRCGKAHARVPLTVHAMNYTLSATRAAFDRRMRTRYRFWFCDACAKPILRLRKMAVWMIVLGVALFLMMPVVLILVGTRTLFSFNILLVQMVFGYVAVMTGVILKARAGSGTVSIVDNGEETVLFRFHNQVYRNHFAELNGER